VLPDDRGAGGPREHAAALGQLVAHPPPGGGNGEASHHGDGRGRGRGGRAPQAHEEGRPGLRRRLRRGWGGGQQVAERGLQRARPGERPRAPGAPLGSRPGGVPQAGRRERHPRHNNARLGARPGQGAPGGGDRPGYGGEDNSPEQEVPLQPLVRRRRGGDVRRGRAVLPQAHLHHRVGGRGRARLGGAQDKEGKA